MKSDLADNVGIKIGCGSGATGNVSIGATIAGVGPIGVTTAMLIGTAIVEGVRKDCGMARPLYKTLSPVSMELRKFCWPTFDTRLPFANTNPGICP